MLNQALFNPADVRVKAGMKGTKWHTKHAAEADAEEEGQLKLFGMLTKACSATIKNMALLMKEEVTSTDPASAVLISIEDAPSTCLWSALTRKFLCSKPALLAAVTTSLVEQCSTLPGDRSQDC